MHFAIISAPVPGHLFPCCMLCKGLLAHNHKVSVYNIIDAKEFVEKLGLRFVPIGEKEFPKGSWHKRWHPAMTGSNLWRDTRILKAHIEIAEMMLRDLPEILKNDKINVLIVDHLQPQGSSLAEKLNIPFFTICSILPLHNDPSGSAPASFAWWQVKDSWFNRKLNNFSHHLVKLLSRSFLKMVNKYRKEWEMPPIKTLEDSFSSIAQIGVVPYEFDFPRPKIKNYFSVGPAITERSKVDFPWHLLDDRPIVYASMGTIRNKMDRFYKTIIEVFKKKPELQLILSKGAWNGDGYELKNLPQNIILVDFVPQLEILKKAKLCITHAGCGTILESIYYGVPLVAIPIADDQPAMAARVAYHNLGVTIPFRKLTKNKLKNTIDQLLNSYKIVNSVANMSAQFKKYGGVEAATEIILEKLKYLNK